MAKKNDQDKTQKIEFVEVQRKTNDDFVVFPDRIVHFVDGKATVTSDERDQMKVMGVI